MTLHDTLHSYNGLSVAPAGQLYEVVLGDRAETGVEERHRHRFEVNPEYIGRLEALGMRFVGQDSEHKRMEILELQSTSTLYSYIINICMEPLIILRVVPMTDWLCPLCPPIFEVRSFDNLQYCRCLVSCADHPYFVGTQYHPEFQSRPMRPSAPFLGLILAASGRDEIGKFLRRPHRFPQLLDVHLAQQAQAAADGDSPDADDAKADTPTKHSTQRRSAFDRREAALDAFRHDDDDQDEWHQLAHFHSPQSFSLRHSFLSESWWSTF